MTDPNSVKLDQIIKVLGSDCTLSQATVELFQSVIKQLNSDAELLEVEDNAAISHYSILSTPGIVLNEELVLFGRVPTRIEIVAWLSPGVNSSQIDTTDDAGKVSVVDRVDLQDEPELKHLCYGSGKSKVNHNKN